MNALRTRISEAVNATSVHDKKPSRSDVLKAIEKMIEVMGDEEFSENKLLIGNAYKHFLPTPPTKPKTPEQWIYKATGKKDVRYFLNEMYSDGEHLVATDGHRLHVLMNRGLPKGYYNSELMDVTKMVDAKFPMWERVIPANTRRCGIMLGELTQRVIPPQKGRNKSWEVLVFPNDLLKSDGFGGWDEGVELGFSKEYVLEAVGGMESPVFNLTQIPYNLSMLITDDADESKQAVVMNISLS